MWDLPSTSSLSPNDKVVDASLLESLAEILLSSKAMQVRQHCKLLGDWFGYLIQVILGVVAFSALVVKKFLDKKQRNWPTWARDTSKQAVGSLVAHLWNLLFATLLSSHGDEDPCVYYFINFVVDAILGCVLSLLMLWGLEKLAEKYKWERLRSGDYGDKPVKTDPLADSTAAPLGSNEHAPAESDPNPNSCGTLDDWFGNKEALIRWAAQAGMWTAIVTISKVVLLFALIVPAKKPLYVGFKWMLSGLENYPKLELAVVMVIVPLILNIVQFWVQDIFLMNNDDEANLKVPAVAPTDSESPGHVAVDPEAARRPRDASEHEEHAGLLERN